MQKIVRLTLKSVAGLLAILFIALLLLLWRLSSSPILLNQYVPRIEQVATKMPGGLSVKGVEQADTHARRVLGGVGRRVDLKQKRMEIGGTIVPFQKLNEIVGMVPLLRQVATSKDGQGVMGVAYTVKGALSQPEFSINNTPLTKNFLDETLGEDKGDTGPDHQ
jgi:hypothetical protein